MDFHVLIKGTASEVFGIDSETVFRKTVSDRRIVTSEIFVGFILVIHVIPNSRHRKCIAYDA